MASVALTREQHRRLVALLAARGNVVTQLGRQNLLEDAGLDSFVARLPFNTDARTFSQALVRELQQHGTLEETGQPALVSLLRELRERVRGHEAERDFLDELLAPYDNPNPPNPPNPLTPPNSPNPDSATLRALLTDAFSDEELELFCADHFHEVYQNFGSGMSKARKIQMLLDHVARRLQTERLLTLIRRARPAQYRRFFGDAP